MDMPMKKKRTVAPQAAARGALPGLPKELLDQLVPGAARYRVPSCFCDARYVKT